VPPDALSKEKQGMQQEEESGETLLAKLMHRVSMWFLGE